MKTSNFSEIKSELPHKIGTISQNHSTYFIVFTVSANLMDLENYFPPLVYQIKGDVDNFRFFQQPLPLMLIFFLPTKE